VTPGVKQARSAAASAAATALRPASLTWTRRSTSLPVVNATAPVPAATCRLGVSKRTGTAPGNSKVVPSGMPAPRMVARSAAWVIRIAVGTAVSASCQVDPRWWTTTASDTAALPDAKARS
jgi:hypothetical protein